MPDLIISYYFIDALILVILKGLEGVNSSDLLEVKGEWILAAFPIFYELFPFLEDVLQCFDRDRLNSLVRHLHSKEQNLKKSSLHNHCNLVCLSVSCGICNCPDRLSLYVNLIFLSKLF